jgi:hypothetical protein
MICFITFMYGPGMPVLFPIGLVGLCILYMVERYSMARYYQLPPNFSNELNIRCMKDILWSPIFYCGIGFWMFTNRQIFENKVKTIAFTTSIIRYDHTFLSVWQHWYPGQPFLIFLGIQICLIFLSGLRLEKLIFDNKTNSGLHIKACKGTYYSAIS